MSLNFGEDYFLYFFFWRSPVFGQKKRLSFRAFREIPSQFSDKPCDSDSRRMKIRVNVVCSFLTLSNPPPPPPPFPNPGYAPDDDYCNCTEILILNRYLTLAVEMSDYHF